MIRHYLVLALKVLLRRKFFTFISLFGVAFTLCTVVLVAAFMDHMLAPEAPETRQDRTLGVYSVRLLGEHGASQSGGSYSLFDRHARNLPGAERLSIYSSNAMAQTFVNGQKVELSLKRTDAEFFEIMQFAFLEGRAYSSQEMHDRAPVAVVSQRVRERVLGGQLAVGRTIELDGQRLTVIGVVSDISELRMVPFADVWAPVTTQKGPLDTPDVMGRFHAIVLGVDRRALAGIRDEFNSRLTRLELPKEFDVIVAPFETKFAWFARQMSLGDRRNTESQAPRLVVLLTIAGLLFSLLPAVNLVNINISRIMERASEIGVRKAFGARSRTLVLQFVVENVLLTLTGSLVAFALSILLLRAINNSGLLSHLQLTVNLRVFAWGVALAVLFGIISGVYPAWRMARLRPVEALKGATR
jgi:putative ABC transport system permease protein